MNRKTEVVYRYIAGKKITKITLTNIFYDFDYGQIENEMDMYAIRHRIINAPDKRVNDPITDMIAMYMDMLYSIDATPFPHKTPDCEFMANMERKILFFNDDTPYTTY